MYYGHYTWNYGAGPLDNAPLLRRGWVLQERLLSPRTLHFTKKEVVWECDHLSACETSPTEMIEAWVDGPLRMREAGNLIWERIVLEYSKMSFTFPKDRLVALAGIVERIGEQTGREYLAGLWLENFEQQLCWANTDHDFDARLRREFDVYISPSWSWAQVADEIQLYKPGTDGKVSLSAKLLKLVINTNGKSHLGQVTEVTLRLGCSILFRTQIFGQRTRKSESLLWWFMVTGAVKVPCLAHLHGEARMPDIFDHSEHKRNLPSEYAIGYDVYVAPIVGNPLVEPVNCLLLIPVAGRKGTYSRVGNIGVPHLTSDDLGIEVPSFWQLAQEHRDDLGPDEYIEVLREEPDGLRYVIEII